MPSRVCHDHTSQPQSVAELEAYAIQVSQLLLETDIGVNLARNQSAVRWEPRTDLAIPTMTGRPHHIDRDWPQPPPDRSAQPSHNHIKKFLKLQRSGLDEVLETIYNTVDHERTDVPSLPAHLRALKYQRSDMDKVLEVIYNNINQERPDVPTCQPELKRKLYGLMADHNNSIKFLTFKLNANGPDYDSMVRKVEQEGEKLVDLVNRTIHLANTIHKYDEYNTEHITQPAVDLAPIRDNMHNPHNPSAQPEGDSRNRLDQPEGDVSTSLPPASLQVNVVSIEENDMAYYSPSDNADQSMDVARDNMHKIHNPTIEEHSSVPHAQPVQPYKLVDMLPGPQGVTGTDHSWILKALKDEELEIREVTDTIRDNIHQERTDLDICIPVLRRILQGLQTDHSHHIKHLTSTLGKDHPVIRNVVQESMAWRETMYQAEITLRETESNWEVCEEDNPEQHKSLAAPRSSKA